MEVTNRIKTFLQQVPLLPKLLAITIIVGITMWFILDTVLTRNLIEISDSQLLIILHSRAHESRVRFDRYLEAHHETAKIIVSHKAFLDFAGSNLSVELKRPLVYYKNNYPEWLPDKAVLRHLVQIQYAVLLDKSGKVREIYQNAPDPLPESLESPNYLLRELSMNQSYLTSINGMPFLVTSESLMPSGMTLMLVNGLNDDFLVASQGITFYSGIDVLVDGSSQKIIASDRPDIISNGTLVESLKGKYIITGKSFFDQGSSEVVLEFVSFIPRDELRNLNSDILDIEHKQRIIIGIISILLFIFILMWISRRIRNLTDNIVTLSKNELDIHPDDIIRGDEINILHDRFSHFSDEILRSREIIKEQASKLLQESEEKFKALFDNAEDGIFILDNKGNFIDVNKSGYERLGYSKDEMLSMNIRQLDSPDFAAKVPGRMDQIRQYGKAVFESAHVSKNGTVMPVEINSRILKYGGKEVYFSIIRDITKRKNAEELLKRNYDTQSVINSLLQLSLENKPIEEIMQQCLDLILSIRWLSFESRGGMFISNDAGDKLIMSAQRGLSEHIRKECNVMPFGKCHCGMAAITQDVQFSARLDEQHDIRYEGITSHGHYCVPILLLGKTLGVINIYISEGHKRDEKEVEFLKAIANVLAGIIQRRKTEEERRKLISDLQITLGKVSQSQKMWQETFDSIGDLISIHDNDFNIIRVNTAFARHFGLDPRDVIRKKCYEIFHGTGSPVLNCPHITTMKENRPVTSEISDDVTGRIFLVSTFPFSFPDAEFIGSIHVAKDITDEKENEMRLIMSERLASLGQMASGIAHEINNPLAAIAGCTEGLQNRIRQGKYDPVFFENYLKIIEEEIMRCKGITTSMLSFVRKTTYEMKETNINEILDKTIDIIGYQGRLKEVNVIKKYMQGIPMIYGNEGELRQVFLSIVINAFDAMDDKGSITLETGSDENNIFINISDTGTGISQDNINRIFNPFFTTKAEKAGTGLGLSIASRIISNHNGSINVSSTEGVGTTFRIILPLKT